MIMKYLLKKINNILKNYLLEIMVQLLLIIRLNIVILK